MYIIEYLNTDGTIQSAHIVSAEDLSSITDEGQTIENLYPLAE